MKNAIIFEDVSRVYNRKFRALDHVNLEVKEGMFGLLGPNGAGKTTLMKLITTLSEPNEGRITVNGFDVVKDKLKVRNIVGFLPQEIHIYPDLTAFEFLDFIGKLNNLRLKKGRRERIAEVLKQVNLFHEKDKKVRGFSGGMKRRLGIAQALLKKPEVLIVDEPTAGLDPEERIRFRTLLVELSQHKVVILSTHIVEDVSASCEKIGLLHNGKLRYVGSPMEFVKQAEGHVREICIQTRGELVTIKNQYPIIAVKQTRDGSRVRVIGDNFNSNLQVIDVEPNLEDAYIYFMENQVRGEKNA